MVRWCGRLENACLYGFALSECVTNRMVPYKRSKHTSRARNAAIPTTSQNLIHLIAVTSKLIICCGNLSAALHSGLHVLIVDM